jgi:serine phosphatase RsbU (regulator of sigma subunit)
MTMLVKAHLDRVAEALPDASPSALLAELDRLVVESLAAETESAHLENGLDIALCRYRSSTDTLHFAGAGLPLFAWRADVAEFPASRAHLGFSGGRRKKEFVDHAIPAASAHRFYLATDGVLDLPGGERGLPFGRTRLRRLIADIAPLSFADAEARSLDAFSAWLAGRGQRDDLTFVGFALRPSKEA